MAEAYITKKKRRGNGLLSAPIHKGCACDCLNNDLNRTTTSLRSAPIHKRCVCNYLNTKQTTSLRVPLCATTILHLAPLVRLSPLYAYPPLCHLFLREHQKKTKKNVFSLPGWCHCVVMAPRAWVWPGIAHFFAW